MTRIRKSCRGSTTVLAIATLLFAWLAVAGLAFFGDELLRRYIARPTPLAPTSPQASIPSIPSTLPPPNLPSSAINSLSASARTPGSAIVTPKAEPIAAPAVVTPTVIAPPPLRLPVEAPRPGSLLTSAGVITWTNLQREQNGLPPFLEHRLLDQAAQAKLDDMFARQYFAHESPTGAGPGEVIQSVGFEYLTVGENLALGDFDNDEKLVNGWMNSPGHRANILHQTFIHIGVAVGKGMYEGRETWLSVQEFGVPKSVCTEPDSVLRQNIDGFDADLSARQKILDQRHAEIQTMDPRPDLDAYNAKVDEFNALVAEYNVLVAEQKTTVNRYNEQVNAFNACLARYTAN